MSTAIVAVCEKCDLDGYCTEATVWVLGDEGFIPCCDNEACAADALEHVGSNPHFEPVNNPPSHKANQA